MNIYYWHQPGADAMVRVHVVGRACSDHSLVRKLKPFRYLHEDALEGPEFTVHNSELMSPRRRVLKLRPAGVDHAVNQI